MDLAGINFSDFAITIFPRIDRAHTIYFSAVIGARINRGRGLLL